MKIQPKLQKVFNEVDNYSSSYKKLEKDNQKYIKEISYLENRNNNLEEENMSLKYRISYVFELIKKLFRKLLQKGNDYTKEETSKVVKKCYDNEEFDDIDVVNISKGTAKQDELFDYVDAPDYLKTNIKDNYKDKDVFER